VDGQIVLPLDPFPKQIEFLEWLAERERLQKPGLCEKSRDAGVTLFCAVKALHRWQWTPGYQFGFGSRKLEYVDQSGNPKSIFEKIRFMFYGQPEWMIPKGFVRRKHDLYCRLVHPFHGAVIVGEGGDDMGRGGRTSMYVVDEAAHLDNAGKVDLALSLNTNVRIDVSSVNGVGNPFYQKRFGGKIAVFIFDWRDDPRKNQAWYDELLAEKGAVVMAQEVDRDYSASLEGICIPARWVQAAVNFDLGLDFDLTEKTVVGMDIAEAGDNKTVMVPRSGPRVRMPIAWKEPNTTQTAHMAIDHGVKVGCTELYYDRDGVGIGVCSAWETTEKEIPFKIIPVRGGEQPSNTVWPDGQKSKEKFKNLRAEIWWIMRTRFEKTWELKQWRETGGKQGANHPPIECISIPNCPELIADLSLPKLEHLETGLIRLESKEKMRARGVQSPDFADALGYSFAPKTMLKFGAY
jgi:hypothetical protein